MEKQLSEASMESTHFLPKTTSSQKKKVGCLEIDLGKFLGKGASAEVYEGIYEYKPSQ